MQFDWSKIDTVLLDMDGTLLDLHFDSHFWLEHMPTAFAQKEGLELHIAKEQLRPIFTSLAGTLDWYCVDFWSRELGLDIMSLKRDVANKIAYLPSAQKFLQNCNDYCQDVRLITNAHRKVLDLKVEKTSIDQYFNSMLCSHELGLPKEEPKFWQKLQQQDFFDPDKTLFIDDNESVLESAESFGIRYLFSIASPDSVRGRSAPSRFEMLERLS